MHAEAYVSRSERGERLRRRHPGRKSAALMVARLRHERKMRPPMH